MPPPPTRRRVMLAALAAGGVVAGSRQARAEGLPVSRELQRDIAAAAAQGQPLVLMVTLAGCPYCEIVRRSYLKPLLDGGHVVRQIDLRSRNEMRGPSGEVTREADLARRWKVGMAPTVLFLGPGGVELAPRLAGFSEDFYGGYLDDALARARARLGGTRG